MNKSKKGDKKKFFGIWFTFDGKIWIMDFIPHKKQPVR